jgi:G3E family GTPase
MQAQRPEPLIPVTLLTGFLGSGKTTLLNGLVRSPLFARTLIIINEFGEIGLDHLLFTHTPEDIVVEMSSGCLCCTIRGDLRRTLKDLPWRFARDGVRMFDRVVIETTGLADPAPILHTLMADDAIASRYKLDGVVTTVDARNAAHTLSSQFEALKQVAVADRLVITKTDLIDSATLQNLQRRLRRISPGAMQLTALTGQTDPGLLLNLGLFNPDLKPPDVLRWLNAEAVAAEPHSAQHPDHRHHAHHHDVNRHDERIRAFCFRLASPVPEESFEAWWEIMHDLAGKDLLRLKGLLNLAGKDRPTAVHAVQHVLHPPVTLERWPSEDRSSLLVFIVRDLGRDTIANSMAALGLR